MAECDTLCGEQGVPGEVGPQGQPGIQGPKGDNGDKGDKGDKGDTGITGADGAAGADGAPGPIGDPGIPGPQGVPGTPGGSGIAGTDGLPGASGAPGTPGAPGLDGAPGADGVTPDPLQFTPIVNGLVDVNAGMAATIPGQMFSPDAAPGCEILYINGDASPIVVQRTNEWFLPNPQTVHSERILAITTSAQVVIPLNLVPKCDATHARMLFRVIAEHGGQSSAPYHNGGTVLVGGEWIATAIVDQNAPDETEADRMYTMLVYDVQLQHIANGIVWDRGKSGAAGEIGLDIILISWVYKAQV